MLRVIKTDRFKVAFEPRFIGTNRFPDDRVAVIWVIWQMKTRVYVFLPVGCSERLPLGAAFLRQPITRECPPIYGGINLPAGFI